MLQSISSPTLLKYMLLFCIVVPKNDMSHLVHARMWYMPECSSPLIRIGMQVNHGLLPRLRRGDMARLGDGWSQRWEGLARTTAALAARLDALEARRCWRMPLQAHLTMSTNSCSWLACASMSRELACQADYVCYVCIPDIAAPSHGTRHLLVCSAGSQPRGACRDGRCRCHGSGNQPRSAKRCSCRAYHGWRGSAGGQPEQPNSSSPSPKPCRVFGARHSEGCSPQSSGHKLCSAGRSWRWRRSPMPEACWLACCV